MVAAAGCARFDDTASSPFTPEPTFGSGGEVQPKEPSPPSSVAPQPSVPDDPCFDRDPNVVATCLDATGGLVMLPDGASALVTERRTGRILLVTQGQAPTEFASVPVDSGSDGGLLDIALSPTFGEDRLVYAYITTATDNRVVRVAPGDVPKDVLTGIPRGAEGNAGSLTFAKPASSWCSRRCGQPGRRGRSGIAGRQNSSVSRRCRRLRRRRVRPSPRRGSAAPAASAPTWTAECG